MRRTRGGAGRAALIQLALLVPVASAAALVVAPAALWLQHRYPPYGGWMLLLVWWLPVLLLLWRPAQREVASVWFGCRGPTADEAARLGSPWLAVLTRAGVFPERFQLMVVDADDVNAHVTVGSVVAVTSSAVGRLSPGELEAVLAHELGHHLGLDAVPAVIAAWLMLPVRVLSWIVRGLWRAAVAALHLALLASRSLVVLLAAPLLFCWFGVVLLVIAVPVPVAAVCMALTRLARDGGEYEADRVASRLGLGPELLAVLESWIPGEVPERSRFERVLGLRPLLVRRVERLRRHILSHETRDATPAAQGGV